MNGSDWPFGFWNFKFGPCAFRSICFHKHLSRSATNPFSIFQNPNSRSEPFILFSILISAWRPNFTFFEIFVLFIYHIFFLLITDVIFSVSTTYSFMKLSCYYKLNLVILCLHVSFLSHNMLLVFEKSLTILNLFFIK